MRNLIIALSVFVLSHACRAQAQATRIIASTQSRASTVPTNAMVGFTNGCKLISVTAFNSSATDLYLHVFDTNAAPANNTRPTLPPIKVTAGTTAGYDFGDGGLPMRYGITVANSTTDRTLTNSSANFMIVVTYDDKRP